MADAPPENLRAPRKTAQNRGPPSARGGGSAREPPRPPKNGAKPRPAERPWRTLRQKTSALRARRLFEWLNRSDPECVGQLMRCEWLLLAFLLGVPLVLWPTYRMRTNAAVQMEVWQSSPHRAVDLNKFWLEKLRRVHPELPKVRPAVLPPRGASAPTGGSKKIL